jgi:hypothetical protein
MAWQTDIKKLPTPAHEKGRATPIALSAKPGEHKRQAKGSENGKKTWTGSC